MKAWTTIANGFSRWIDAVADFIVALPWRATSSRTVKLVEVDDGEFVVQAAPEHADTVSTTERIRITDGQIVGTVSEPIAVAVRGSHVELTLKPQRFLFRPFELPGRALEFIDGVIRAQIDRLTPWNASEAAFGWSKPHDAGPDRIVVTVAATARPLVSPYVRAIAGLGVQSVEVLTIPGEHEAAAAAIKVMEEKTSGIMDVGKIRQLLIIILIVTAVAAAVAFSGSALIGISLDAQQAVLTRRIASLRGATGASSDGGLGTFAAARHSAEIRKHTAPSSVMIIETLSRILPDDTYVTELHIEDNRVQLVGMTRDAPSLIGLMEQSGVFSQATFFAPTTRSPSDSRERFHIEALIHPTVTPRT
jgi:general secretion pathway protein L